MKHESTKRLSKVLAAFLAVLTLAAGSWAVYTDNLPWPDSRKTEGGSQEVTKDGGVLTFPNGIVITVPKGAVKNDTTLTVGGSTQLAKDEAGPFTGLRTGAVKFDVSLSADGKSDIQPLVPLGIAVPLSGNLLPEGAKPSQALLYTAIPKGGFQLVQATADKQNVLRGSLSHLSPKYVSYIDEQAFMKAFGISGIDLKKRGDCKNEVSASSTGKVKIGGDTVGWSADDKNTPILACLTADENGDPHLGIANRLNYILSVAHTNGIELKVSSGDFDEEVAKGFARVVFPNRKIKAFVGRGGRIDAKLLAKSLPATVQLKADPNTFLAEAGWFALNFTVSVLVGEDAGVVAKRAKFLLGIPEVVKCLKSIFDISTGNLKDFNFWSAVDLVSSKCIEAIVEASGLEPLSWGAFGKWFGTIGNGLSGGWKLVGTATEGIRMQRRNPMTVEVVRSVLPCPSANNLKPILIKGLQDALGIGRDVWDIKVLACSNGWAHVYAASGVHDPQTDTDGTFLLHVENGAWKSVDGGQDLGGSEYCRPSTPSEVRGWLNCY